LGTLDLPVPTIHAMRIIIQLKAVHASSIVVIDAYSFKYALQNARTRRRTINLSANLHEDSNDILICNKIESTPEI
jgi:hypothetical protein